jgi:hypothetical protein
LWAGFCALVNQQASATGSGTNTVGFINPALYAIGAGAGYTACFHDTVTGNNIGDNTPGLFYATNGYDLCTGLGTPLGTNLVNSLAPPAQAYFIVQPAGVSVTNGGHFTLCADAVGPAPLEYQWFFNGVTLAATNAAGAATSVLTVTNCTGEDAGDYSVVVSSGNGTMVSLVATVSVFQPPIITTPLAGETVQCGGNVSFAITVSGDPWPDFQWSEDGVPLAGATNATLTLNDVHFPNHAVAVAITNLFGGITNTVTLAVEDTDPPVITLNGANPLYLELGSAFIDPGATATDACAGAVAVIVTGSVDTNEVGTNELSYEASDGNGNSSEVTRAVVVRDTTPPAILWSFTNLVIAAGADCNALMPDVTGTNFMMARDLSGPPLITQIPPTNAVLALGTNLVILIATDTSGNASYATNAIIVQDETPPLIASQPQSATNLPGATVTFALTASACTPLTYQWFFDQSPLVGQTAPVLTLASVALTNAGSYDVVAMSAGGSTTSSVALLSIVSPPVIIWSFTNLILAADGSCEAEMPDVTGTNYIEAAGGEGDLLITQTPDTNAVLDLGTNTVVIRVSDSFGDSIFSTNTIVVQDETPPVIIGEPESVTDNLGGAATLTVTATACTPLSYQWFFDGEALPGETNPALVLGDVGAADEGDYFVIVTAAGGSTTSAVAQLTVTANPTLVLTVASNPGGGFVLTASGPAVGNCILEMETDLTDSWLPLFTNDFGNGTAQFIDTAATNDPQRFYRALWDPASAAIRQSGSPVTR